MNTPKAKWERNDGLTAWFANIGTYTLEADSSTGSWAAYEESFDTSTGDDFYEWEEFNKSGCFGANTDIVKLMLEAEDALRTHLLHLAETLVWPT